MGATAPTRGNATRRRRYRRRVRIVEIWRYPIKSVGGERLGSADVGATGIADDRGWGLVDDLTGNVLTARREPRLLFGSARMIDGAPVVTIESGE